MRIHKNHYTFTIVLIVLLFVRPNVATAATAQPQHLLQWSELPALPDPIGFAGPFVGVSNDALIVAGGANFPDGPPWNDFPKVWHDEVFVLTEPDGKWRTGFKLTQSIAYGISVTWNRYIACLGGGDSERHYSEAFLLHWTGETIETIPLPSLPKPCAFGAGVLFGDTVYVAGGQESPSSEKAMKNFWILDLSLPAGQRRWEDLISWPGEARILPVMAVQDGDIFLISGARLYHGPDKKVTREFLIDGYRYSPQKRQWRQISNAPRPIVAAPNPGIPIGYAHILFLSGDDGKHFFTTSELKDKHPGFGAQLHLYHTITDTWTIGGNIPKTIPLDLGPKRNYGIWPPVTTTCAEWRGKYVIPTGEIKPGVRTPKVLAAKRLETQKRFGMVNWIFLAVYLMALVAIGVKFARREKSTDDFFLASRRIPWWAAGLSIFGTQLSAITYLAMPARAFAANWWPLVMNMGILVIAPLVVYVYLPQFRRLNITTAYEFLEQRFDVSIRLLGSLAFVTFQIGRMGIVVLLPALALSAVTGINVFVCIALMGLLSTLYTVLGGIEAVIWTDVLQAIVLTGGALAALVIVISRLDGVGELISVGLAQDKFDLAYLNWDWTSEALAVVILGAIFTNSLIPYTTDQAVIQRYLATPDEKQAAKAIWFNGIMAIPIGLLFLLVGTGLYVFYSSNPDKLTPLDKADQIFAFFISNEMPVGLAGLVIAGVFAAAMSSLDSSMHSISTVVTTDIVRRFWTNLSEVTYLRIAQGLTVILGISGTAAALFMASIDIRFLLDFFLGILGLLGGTIAGVFVLGIFVPRVHTWHVWTGSLASMFVLLYVKLQTNLNGLLYGSIGVCICCLVATLCSFLTHPGSVTKTDT